MVQLRDILDFDLLQAHLTNRIVSRQNHPLYPKELFIYNYTPEAQYGRIWDCVTNVCRGLIVAGDYVLARGFNKFHNLNTPDRPETMEENLPNFPPLVTEKLDGSMGLIYRWDNKVWVATRGSFVSEQAKWATEWIRQRDPWIRNPEGYTVVTEIIYPDNRIVVEYTYSGLWVTGVIENATGDELQRENMVFVAHQLGLPAVKKFDKTLAECAAENVSNEEGYVLTYYDRSPPLKVKVKFEEYVRLHRILTGLNPRAVWEMLIPPEMLAMLYQQNPAEVDPSIAERRRVSVDSILNDPKMPAGFIEWFDGWVNKLRSDYSTLESQAQEVFSKRPEGDRKTIALFFKKTPALAPVLFAMLDQKDYEHIIWKHLKPRGDDTTTYKRDGE